MKRASMIGFVAFAAACTGGGGGEEGDGTAMLRFSVTQTVRTSPSLVDPLIGTIHGGIFLASDVTTTGPIEGAEIQAMVELAVDLEAAMETMPWQAPPLAADRYVFLGFLDLDGNFAATMRPDAGDPVTLPGGGFDVVAGEAVEVAARFDLVFN
jgi:hypothetical protein